MCLDSQRAERKQIGQLENTKCSNNFRLSLNTRSRVALCFMEHYTLRIKKKLDPALTLDPRELYLQSLVSKLVQSLSRLRLFATPWITARQASLSITNSRSSLRLMSIKSVMPSSHLILCCPLLLLAAIPPSIRVFYNESTLRMRWPKYWSFSFSIIPSKEIPGLSSFRMDWFDLLALQGMLKSLLQQHSSKASSFQHSAFFTVLQSLMKVQAPGRPCPALCILPWLPTWALDVCLAAPPGCVSKTHFHFTFPCSLLLSCDITSSTEDLDLTNVSVTKSQQWY